MKIPLLDLKQQYQRLRAEIDAELRNVLESAVFIMGPAGVSLTEEISSYCDVKHVIPVASGTDALHLAIRACGIGPGDEVITTPFTFIGTCEAISYTGAQPVFVDIEEDSLNIDASQIEASITERTRAIVAVHLFGQPANLDALTEICRNHGLSLIEDCAQSFGARYRNKMTGTWGNAGCFSFYPSKNLGAYGDGGMVITDDDVIAQKITSLHNHGSCEPYTHNMIGYNSRLDEIQAAVLRVKLRYIDEFNTARRKHAQQYARRLANTGIVLPREQPHSTHVYHQYTVRSDNRDSIQTALKSAGIAFAIFYPIPLHRQPVYQDSYATLSLPVAEKAASQVLSLPMFPELTEKQINEITDVILATL